MGDKIRILFLCDEIDAATGGSEQNIAMLLNNLPAEKYLPYLALLRKEKALPNEFSRVISFTLGFKSYWNVLNSARVCLALRKLIQNNYIDILQVYFRDSQLISALSFPETLGCKLVMARRSLGYHYSSFMFERNRIIGCLATHYLVNSLSIKNELVEKEKVSENKIKVIYNPIDLSKANNGLSRLIDKVSLGIDPNNLVIGIVANIRPVKDYETFFRAARIVKKKIPNVLFLIVGSEDPEYWERIKHLVQETSLNGKCIFLKYINNSYAVIPIFDVGVLTSTSEGLSNSLIEYGVAGIPAVATKVGGNDEVIIDGITGFLAPVACPEIIADKIVDLLKNKNKRLEMGFNAKKYIMAKFDPENIINQYDFYYSDLLKEK